jgi:hypothetical protein
MTSRSDRVPEHALSVMQPWASAIVHGSKRIENRTWRPFQLKDGPFAIWIHASAKPDRASLDHPTPALHSWGVRSRTVRFSSPAWGLTCGAIIGAAVVEDVRDGLDRLPDGQEGWWAGPLAWVLRGVVALDEPVRASGRLGLWRPTPEIQAACVARLPGGWHV